MSRLIQMGDFFFNEVFDLVISCCERVVVDEDGAIGGDGFDDGGNGLQKRAQGVDALVECGVDRVAELDEDRGVAERLEHVSG